MVYNPLRSLGTAILILMGVSAAADPLCDSSTNALENMVTNVCWTCMFPIVVGGQQIIGEFNDNAFTGNPGLAHFEEGTHPRISGAPHDRGDIPILSECDGKACVTTGRWSPFRIIEFTRNPGCSRALGGIDVSHGLSAVSPDVNLNWGTYAAGSENGQPVTTYFNYHVIAFPITTMLSMASFSECTADQSPDMDLLLISEIDPTWNNPDLAFHVTPENAAVATPVAALSCAPEGVSASFGRPLNRMFWCAGSWGGMFPINGHTAYANKPAQETAALFANRAMYMSHRRGMSFRVYKQDTLCKPRFTSLYPKTQYRWQLLGPIPDAKRAIWTGSITARWAAGKNLPTEVDPMLLMFRWEDCCFSDPSGNF